MFPKEKGHQPVKINITEIAKGTGLSRSTVSRVVNGSSPVKLENRELVLEYMERRRKTADNPPSRREAQYVIGIGLPSRPAFFWDQALEGILSASREYPKDLLHLKIMRFSGDSRGEQETLNIIDLLEKANADAYMLVPFSSEPVRRRLELLAERVPVAIFNDFIDFSGRFFYAGSDHFEGGRKAASLIADRVAPPRNVLIISPLLDYISVSQRISGFKSCAHGMENTSIAGNIISEECSTITPSIIARKISKFGAERFNCIYVPDGTLNLVGSALLKLGLFKSVFCVGHEFCRQSEKQFSEGLKGACISEDIFYQGYITVKKLAEYVLHRSGTFGSTVISGYDIRSF